MKTSENGLKFIKANETGGMPPGKYLKPYPDPVGIPTIGVGHKILPGEDFSQGITEEQVLELLAKDVEHVENFVNMFLARNKLTCTQNQFDCLIDFGFNAGVGSLGMLLSHGFDQVAIQLQKWIYAGGKILPGLVIRRHKEGELFIQE